MTLLFLQQEDVFPLLFSQYNLKQKPSASELFQPMRTAEPYKGGGMLHDVFYFMPRGHEVKPEALTPSPVS